MADETVAIPEKIYFKIGEVCELVGVQAHVLRYWETEFPMLSPQKNKSGQRSFRRRDVEIALRIKQLLYKEMFTIAGAKKKLQQEAREGSAAKSAPAPPPPPSESKPAPILYGTDEAPMLFDVSLISEEATALPPENGTAYTASQRDALKVVAGHLLELREMLRTSHVS